MVRTVMLYETKCLTIKNQHENKVLYETKSVVVRLNEIRVKRQY